MPLSIELESTPLCIETTALKGHLLLPNDSLLPDSTCLVQVVCTVDHQETVLLSDVLLPWHLCFDIPLQFDDDNNVEYSVRAHVRGLKNGASLNAARPLSLFQIPPSYPASLCSSLSSLSSTQPRLCWGMSAQSQWQYELELPQRIEGSFEIALRTRLRTTSGVGPLESCLIGVQVYESAGSETILMATSHVLSEPSLTWAEEPCVMLYELDQRPSSRKDATYHLKITLNYSSPTGQTDWVDFNCIIPLYLDPMWFE